MDDHRLTQIKEQRSHVLERTFKVKDKTSLEGVLEPWKENGNLWTQQIRNNDIKCDYRFVLVHSNAVAAKRFLSRNSLNHCSIDTD